MSVETELADFAERLLDMARSAGADQAIAGAGIANSLEAQSTDGAIDEIGRSESLTVGVRVIIGSKQACVSASSGAADTLKELAERAVAMAREAPDDPYCALIEASEVADALPDLDLHDPGEPDPEILRAEALAIDAATVAFEGVARCDGGSSSHWRSRRVMRATNGLSTDRIGSVWSFGTTAIAGEGLGMERDYAYSSTRWLEDRKSIEDVAREAAQRTVRRLNPRKAPSGPIPVIYEQRLASSLVGHFIGAINGASIARGSSFLRDRMGMQVFAAGTKIVDDPLIRRGMSSRPIDSDGMATDRTVLVEDGMLQTWLLDAASARQLGLRSTASSFADIGATSRPGCTNVTIAPGTQTPEDLFREIGTGFYVTEMLGASINPTTGEYSRGASGLWIENGELAYPVAEATVAGNLIDMFANLRFANDIPQHRSIAAPTALVEGCHVSG